MTFGQAVAYAFDGRRVRRKKWEPSSYVFASPDKAIGKFTYLHINGGKINDGKPHVWVISDKDYSSKDWEVVQ